MILSEPIGNIRLGTMNVPSDGDPLAPLGVALAELVPLAGGKAPEHPVELAAPDADPVEAALAEALHKAASAGQWAVVAKLADELEARRNRRSNQGTRGAS